MCALLTAPSLFWLYHCDPIIMCSNYTYFPYILIYACECMPACTEVLRAHTRTDISCNVCVYHKVHLFKQGKIHAYLYLLHRCLAYNYYRHDTKYPFSKSRLTYTYEYTCMCKLYDTHTFIQTHTHTHTILSSIQFGASYKENTHIYVYIFIYLCIAMHRYSCKLDHLITS